MRDFDQQLKVWTLGQGPRGRWKLRLETTDLDDALAQARALEDGGEWPCVSELGAFTHNGKRVVAWVTFWWCTDLNDDMNGPPPGRGQGWYDDEDVFVSYEHPTSAAGPWGSPHAPIPVPAVSRGEAAATPYTDRQTDVEDDSEPAHHGARYIEAVCDDCGLIAPMNELSPISREVKFGRTSGIKRASYSRSNGHSRSGTSVTSGRTFYRNTQLMLCTACYQDEVARQRLQRPLLVQIAEALFNKLQNR